jgi:HAD superfamily hydrolase (TIGR01490 family)
VDPAALTVHADPLRGQSDDNAVVAGAVAIFDLDGTITFGDTYLAFLLFVLRARPQRLIHCIGLPGALAGFALGRVSNDTLKRRFLRAILGGSSRMSLDALAKRFARHCCDRLVKPAARERIEWHRRRGHHLVLATASPDLHADAIGRALGFDDIVCTRAAWDGDRVTGELAGANLRGEAKLATIRSLGIFQGVERAYVFAYSDHRSDLPLLRFADQATVVDPSRRFAAEAEASGLRIERWRQRAG